MSKGVNKAILVGRLGADPETRHTSSGAAVTNISLATEERWKDKQTGEDRKETEWHRIVFFNRLAEVADQYLRKGAQVYVEGRIQTQKWQDRDGRDRYTTQIVAREMQMLGGGARGEDRGAHEGPREAAGTQSSAPPEDFDDDIPF